MSRHSKKTDPKHNARLAWLATQYMKGRPDASVITEMMQVFAPVSEKTCRAELKELYQRFSEINDENIPLARDKLMELTYTMIEECRNALQLGPAVNALKLYAQISGVLTDKVKLDQTVHTDPAPKADTVRDRISTLMDNPEIKKKAQKLGLDLDDIDLKK
jgi:hypothetical protein